MDVSELISTPKLRLDAYLASKLPQTSRARLQASIKEGLVIVNGSTLKKAAYVIKPGDTVLCSVLPPPPLEAAPEPLPIDIVYEDEHLIIVNKSADMVMHPSPGHYTGTMVNALLYHCGLPAVKLGPGAAPPPQTLENSNNNSNNNSNSGSIIGITNGEEWGDDNLDLDDDVLPELVLGNISTSSVVVQEPQTTSPLIGEDEGSISLGTRALENGGSSSIFSSQISVSSDPVIRPGIVHRLDKGTTGLVVIAKTDLAHASLCRQFKDRSVGRAYLALTLGTPKSPSGRVQTNIGRDFRDRKKMAAFEYASATGRLSASNYKVIEGLGSGRAALVEWRLETGRTHQIRVHSKYLGHPLVGDEAYGGGSGTAVSVLGGGKAARVAAAHAVLKVLGRPALHAKTLAIDHPVSGERLEFDSELPDDFNQALDMLRAL